MRRFAIIALFVLCACGQKHPAASDASPPPLLIDERGATMPLEQAITHVTFRPFVPAQAMAFAVLPPLGGLDSDANRGIGVEYLAGRDAMLLSEWPKQRFSIGFGHGTLTNCDAVHYSNTNVAWSTPSNVLMTLQPDGNATTGAVDLEAKRLITAGACR